MAVRQKYEKIDPTEWPDKSYGYLTSSNSVERVSRPWLVVPFALRIYFQIGEQGTTSIRTLLNLEYGESFTHLNWIKWGRSFLFSFWNGPFSWDFRLCSGGSVVNHSLVWYHCLAPQLCILHAGSTHLGIAPVLEVWRFEDTIEPRKNKKTSYFPLSWVYWLVYRDPYNVLWKKNKITG